MLASVRGTARAGFTDEALCFSELRQSFTVLLTQPFLTIVLEDRLNLFHILYRIFGRDILRSRIV